MIEGPTPLIQPCLSDDTAAIMTIDTFFRLKHKLDSWNPQLTSSAHSLHIRIKTCSGRKSGEEDVVETNLC